MRPHRGNDIRKILYSPRVVSAYEQVDGVAAGGYDYIPAFGLEHPVIFTLDHRGADCGLFRRGKAQLFKRFFKLLDSHAFIIRYKRRSDACDNRHSR